MNWTAALCALICLASPACVEITYDYSKEPDPRKREFVVGVSDRLKITVWKNADLSTEVTVRPDGTITLPLLGDIHAAGSTPSQLKEEVAKRLSAYIKDEGSTVTIAVIEVNSYRFTVSGNVEHGGVFSSKFYVTVTDAIALAGGLNKFASPRGLVIVRSGDGGKSRRIPIDYQRVSGGEHPEENLGLLPGDSLFVP